MNGSMSLAVLLVFLAAMMTKAATPISSDGPSPYSWACTSVWQPMGPPTTACANNSCNPVQANIDGKVLVLSTGSMSYTHGGFNPAGSNPGDCCSLCRQTDQCSAWVFCNSKDGCGAPGACTSYIKSLPSSMIDSSAKGLIPAAAFGYFGGCNPDGRFPFHTCSLKQVSSTGSPSVFGQGASSSEGWISGVVSKPVSRVQGCPAGLTEATCKACAATRSPRLCFACAQSSRAWQPSNSVPSACVDCANAGKC